MDDAAVVIGATVNLLDAYSELVTRPRHFLLLSVYQILYSLLFSTKINAHCSLVPIASGRSGGGLRGSAATGASYHR